MSIKGVSPDLAKWVRSMPSWDTLMPFINRCNRLSSLRRHTCIKGNLRESVRHNFLIPRLLRDHLCLYASLLTGESYVEARVPVHGEEKLAVTAS